MPSKWIVLTMVAMSVGCQSAEERCNVAKVAAHDAWAEYVRVVEADDTAARSAFSELETANRPTRDSACRGAWHAYVTELSRIDSDGELEDGRPHYGADAIMLAVWSVQPAQAADPCASVRDGGHTDEHGGDYNHVADAMSRLEPATFRQLEDRLLSPTSAVAIQTSETAAVASGEIPQALVDQRDTAIRNATAAYEAATEEARQRQAWTTRQLAAAQAALAQSTSGAIAARDAAHDVEADPAHAEAAAARSAADSSWEACQGVSP